MFPVVDGEEAFFAYPSFALRRPQVFLCQSFGLIPGFHTRRVMAEDFATIAATLQDLVNGAYQRYH
jgi:hypothetical protein